MRIKEITYQHRRDFKAVMECGHYGHEQDLSGGYDDEFYHANVIPKILCQSCGKKAGESYRPLKTKYEEGVQI